MTVPARQTGSAGERHHPKPTPHSLTALGHSSTLSKVLWLLWLIVIFEIITNTYAAGVESDRKLVQENGVRRLLLTSTEKKSIRQRQVNEKTPSVNEDEDERKTLVQQVADGKYGLIQKELFSKHGKRPGIISYEVNPEVPKDNINNLGGLQPEEIWLAENHLLVLKGGGLSDKESDSKNDWPPIDNYKAPKRPVKIPPKPKIPPPFPIQLTDDGPIEFIKRDNSSGRGGYPPIPPSLLPQPNLNPFIRNRTKGNFSTPYPIPPFLYPPLLGLYPPIGNISDIDEDDPRFYYPPPYDFVYKKDNSSFVSPGPLVPGIVVPPPPNFFAPLNHRVKTYRPPTESQKTSTPYRKPPKTSQNIHLSTLKNGPRSEMRNFSSPTVSLKSPQKAINFLQTKENLTTTSRTPVKIIHSLNFPKLKKPEAPKIPIGEWIPIVGPSICFLDGKKCFDIPIRNSDLLEQLTIVYNHSKSEDYHTTAINDITPSKGHLLRTSSRGKIQTSTESPYNEFKPIIVNPILATPSYETKNQFKQKETYFFYEEPQITEAEIIDAGVYLPVSTKKPDAGYFNQELNKYETNTVSPAQEFNQQTLRKPKLNNQIKTSRLHLYEQQLKQFNPGGLINSRPLNSYSTSWSTVSPTLEPSSFSLPIESYGSNLNSKLTKQQDKYESQYIKPEKTPIFEYSFSAPGYGSYNVPKISLNIPSTDKPVTTLSPGRLRHNQFSYFEYNSEPNQASTYKTDVTTSNPVYYTTLNEPSRKAQKQYVDLRPQLQTESPFVSMYTKSESELIDDITKNYFTHFGKKINSESYPKYITTPLPELPNSYKKPSYAKESNGYIREMPAKKQNIRFPEEPFVPQSDEVYYRNHLIDEYNSAQKYHQSTVIPKPHFPAYNRQVQRGHSLESDVRVNYRKPLPPLNPDAEFIDPNFPHQSNAYISYQLPGNGGHLYFLTPQSISAENYHLASSGVRYPKGYNRVYYKRNVRITSDS